MMDKIEKIKAELERRISRCEKKHPQLMSDKDFTDEENEIYCEECAYREILSFIDSLQDEPNIEQPEYIRALKTLVADWIFDHEDADRAFWQKVWDWLDELLTQSRKTMEQYGIKGFDGVVVHEGNILGIRMDETPAPENVEPIDTSDLVFSGESIVAHKVETISYPPRMIDALRFKKRKMEIKMWKTLSEEERLEYIRLHKEIKKEAESDDLEKAAEEYTDGINWAKENYVTPYIRLSFKAGANWQKEQFEKNRLDACDKITKEEYNLETALLDKYIKKYKRLPMFADAINYGIELQIERDHDACLSCESSRDVVFHKGCKHAIEQMKKEAVEGTVCKQRDSSQATWIELAPNSLPAFDDCELVKCIILKDENGDSCTGS